MTVWRRRNLGAAENWGRTVEARNDAVRTRFERELQSLSGLNRYSAASAADLSRIADGIEAGIRSLPTTVNASSVVTDRSPMTFWTEITRVTIQPDEGKTLLSFTAIANCAFKVQGASASLEFVWPFPPETITSEYGMRYHPISGTWRMHWGTDFSYSGILGDPIVAPGSGTVLNKGFDSSRGNWISVSHPGNITTIYFHLQFPSPLAIGATVTIGVTVLGQVGSTGDSTGPHLHWETLVNGVHWNPRDFIDVYGYGSSGGVTDGSDRIRFVINGVPTTPLYGWLGEAFSGAWINHFGTVSRTVRLNAPVTIALEAISGGGTYEGGSVATLSVMAVRSP